MASRNPVSYHMLVRDMDEQSAKSLRPGSDHYTSFVGPPRQYDFMGGTQFALLFALGLREHHKLLDFGCGSLRAGRLLIPYLNPDRYFGIEPNTWLIEEALRRQLGRDAVKIKRPSFSYSDAFSAEVFGPEQFDFILAQSIFSHAGPEIVRKVLASFVRVLAPNGICAVTFIEGDSETPNGWHYPSVISYRTRLIRRLVAEAPLAGVQIPWFHPRQSWWLLAHSELGLPQPSQREWLRGIVLRDDELAASIPVSL